MTICTVATKSHLGHARTLAKSIRLTNPTAEIYVLLADRVDGFFDPLKEPFKLILMQDLGFTELIARMAFYYGPFELCNALRPFLHDYIWKNTTAQSWIYLDCDINVMGDLSPVFRAVEDASVLLCPHLDGPIEEGPFFSHELSNLKYGIYNSGFLGLNRCEQTSKFIPWFMKRMMRFCFQDYVGLFVDQIWLNHVPNFFGNVKSLRHPGANLAHWNLFQRTITRTANEYLVNGQPLIFVHFSGWDINQPNTVSKYTLAYDQSGLAQVEHWRTFATHYRMALLANGYAETTRWPYAFGRYADGKPITQQARRDYYQQVWHTNPAPPPPWRGSEAGASAIQQGA